MSNNELDSGTIRLHILHHAARPPVFGMWIIEELGRHGHRLIPCTLYPILHGLEHKGYLRSKEKREGQQVRCLYRATPAGRKTLEYRRRSKSENRSESCLSNNETTARR